VAALTSHTTKEVELKAVHLTGNTNVVGAGVIEVQAEEVVVGSVEAVVVRLLLKFIGAYAFATFLSCPFLIRIQTRWQCTSAGH
jgi:hypothetical protein